MRERPGIEERLDDQPVRECRDSRDQVVGLGAPWQIAAALRGFDNGTQPSPPAPVPGSLGCLRVSLVEVIEDGGDGGMQAVEVEAVEAGPRGRLRDAVVALAQPADEIEHVGVAPHPGGEALEVGQRLRGPGVAPRPSHEAVDAPGVGEVGLCCDAAEAEVDDEPLGQLGSPLVELVGAVRGLADEHDAGVARELEDGIEVVHRPCHRPCRFRDRVDQGLV